MEVGSLGAASSIADCKCKAGARPKKMRMKKPLTVPPAVFCVEMGNMALQLPLAIYVEIVRVVPNNKQTIIM